MSAVNKAIMIFAKALAALIIAGMVLGVLSLASDFSAIENSEDTGGETGDADIFFGDKDIE